MGRNRKKMSPRLTEAQAQEIIRDFKANQENSYVDVAFRTGYSYAQVARVLSKL